MSYSPENALIAAFLTKPVRPAAIQGRKEPLIFTRRTKRPDHFAALPPEPEDAKLTGATRSLYRRLLALNLVSVHRMPVATAAPPVMQSSAKIA